jgi:hypothetical protein
VAKAKPVKEGEGRKRQRGETEERLHRLRISQTFSHAGPSTVA